MNNVLLLFNWWMGLCARHVLLKKKMTDKELEALSPWNENIKNVRKVTHCKYSRSKNCSLEKSQTAVFINILFYLALTFFFCESKLLDIVQIVMYNLIVC